MLKNTLFFGDNLCILRDHIPDESIDLIYLDPPFNSNRSYNVLFKEESGKESAAQIQAFDDAWHWDRIAIEAYNDICSHAPRNVVDMIEALHRFIGQNQMMAYLVMMTARLVELHRVLKPTGSLYLHCDPTASHYLKIILDTIFGADQFRNEIIWKRTSARSDSHKWNHIHDVLLFYTKSDSYTWHTQYTSYDEEYTKKFYHNVEAESGRRYTLSDLMAAGLRGGSSGKTWRGVDPAKRGNHWKYTIETLDELDKQGRIVWPKKEGGVPRYKRYLDEMQGVAIQSIINDITPLPSQSLEKLGYPTQKPLALLERIIQASSNPGDIVLDPFCGCGTAIAAAEKFGRQWIGIDITYLAINLVKNRLRDMFPDIAINIQGAPKDLASAEQLAQVSRYQFQWWAVSLVDARQVSGETGKDKKGADKGIDGVLYFPIDNKLNKGRVIVQVKSGGVGVKDVRELEAVVEREGASIGVLITLEAPTKNMRMEAAENGNYTSDFWEQSFPKIQIYTVDQLLRGEKILMPPEHGTFAKATVQEEEGKQRKMF